MTRTDRLGDVVLSLPAVDLLAGARPDWELHLMVAPAAVPLVEGRPGLARVWTWRDDLEPPRRRALRQELRAAGFGAAVLLQYRRELAALLKDAGIARRHGPLSHPSSWFLLNAGQRQARSRGDAHEADLGTELVARLAGVAATAAPLPRLHPRPEVLAEGRAFRAERAPDAATVAFVHPGSGGSALDWAPRRFAALASALAGRPGWRVFVTGAGRDAAAVAALRPGLDPRVEVLLDACDLRGLVGLLAAGDVFVGPSTGPLHMASALDLATVGLYPPVRTMAPVRWGPRGRWARAP
ncbi:MAG: glycosyltransferase family 9 protein, partial [Krumholzibacteria bacterium]|nr:glycosyltransferase family 9 protein [Candidatus Krumholzibacteria bacterium]